MEIEFEKEWKEKIGETMKRYCSIGLIRVGPVATPSTESSA